ncbi:MAG TPA: YraN family protein [Chlorobiota bacterium]|nr:YraN family protein [Chlorobiota bacterium]
MTTPDGTTSSIGEWAENIAARHLEAAGWIILERNWKYKNMGEIDIIAVDGEVLVFIEVRYRTRTEYGTPEDSITAVKVRKVRRTAELYMIMKGRWGCPCRCDAIAVDLADGKMDIRHYRDAF